METTDIYKRFNSCSSKEPIVISDNSKPLQNIEQYKSWIGAELYRDYQKEFKKAASQETESTDKAVSYNSSMGYTEELLINEALMGQRNRFASSY
ncbi:hypothetical protein [Flavobacterium agrisoli]|uniref:Uncharacterized protein n=1 Tax=Flavobacterium agrisoli TaxID=2793066 RepID=A0A934PIV1_9FLAO|nr:hypothetical protein [Flavobacterium agrisoli]MBK0368921.1 hypothetical protein [Flavobacterium agrisoli]